MQTFFWNWARVRGWRWRGGGGKFSNSKFLYSDLFAGSVLGNQRRRRDVQIIIPLEFQLSHGTLYSACRNASSESRSPACICSVQPFKSHDRKRSIPVHTTRRTTTQATERKYTESYYLHADKPSAVHRHEFTVRYSEFSFFSKRISFHCSSCRAWRS